MPPDREPRCGREPAASAIKSVPASLRWERRLPSVLITTAPGLAAQGQGLMTAAWGGEAATVQEAAPTAPERARPSPPGAASAGTPVCLRGAPAPPVAFLPAEGGPFARLLRARGSAPPRLPGPRAPLGCPESMLLTSQHGPTQPSSYHRLPDL